MAAYLATAYGIGNAFEQIDTWVGRLFSATSRSALDDAVRAIAGEARILSIQAHTIRQKFYVWQPDDRPPASVIRATANEKATLAGEEPTIDDFRAGRFAPRSAFEDIADEAETWIARC